MLLRRRNWLVSLAVGISLLVVSATDLARNSANYMIEPDVISSSSGAMSSTNYALDSTAGQTTAGFSSSTQYQLSGGFWEDSHADTNLYLPLIMKQSG